MGQQETEKSLLVAAQLGHDPAWRRLAQMYRPFIQSWASNHTEQSQDAEDLSQEILLAVFRALPRFEHNGRTGAFRAWLRTLAVHCTHDFRSSRQDQMRGSGDSAMLDRLRMLEDSKSELSHEWDQQHDTHVLSSLLDSVSAEFEPRSMQAFCMQALEGASAEIVADKLGLSLSAVYTAKSRVLRRLREVSKGLLDWRGDVAVA